MGRAELETRVLQMLRANGAQVPEVLAFDGEIRLQEDLGKTRLSMALKTASAAEAEKLLDTALASLAKTHAAAKTAGLKRFVPSVVIVSTASQFDRWSAHHNTSANFLFDACDAKSPR